jgi:hypothetical protein
MAGCSQRTAIEWFSVFRDICVKFCETDGNVIGGPGLIVEIDESLVARRKYNVGRIVPQRFVWAAYCPSQGLAVCRPISSHRRDELEPLVLRHVRQGSVVTADGLASYNNLASFYQLRRVNHSVNYVDPMTGATTNHAEAFWSRLKAHLRSVRGSQGDKVYEHVCEVVYRQNNQFHSSLPWPTMMSKFVADINRFRQPNTTNQSIPIRTVDEQLLHSAFIRHHRGTHTLQIVAPSPLRAQATSPNFVSPPNGSRSSPVRLQSASGQRQSSSRANRESYRRRSRSRRSPTVAIPIVLEDFSLEDAPVDPNDMRISEPLGPSTSSGIQLRRRTGRAGRNGGSQASGV